MIYVYTDRGSNSRVARIFARIINIPDEYGAVIRSRKIGTQIICACERGTYVHKLVKRDPQVMKFKGIYAKTLNATGRNY